uniref:Uncharacterized protein n=1 Tax=Tanacetum cinerariifolium TaxID=118510 RepID=A0A699GN68_TANCI|nr:hypothetical protein [Tanacetum cinerariifolium]
MCICLKDHLDAAERIQHIASLEDGQEYERQFHDVEVTTGEANIISDEELALNEATSEDRSSEPEDEDANLEQALIAAQELQRINLVYMTVSTKVSTAEKLENASKSVNKLIDYQIVENYKKGLGYESYNAVPPPYTGNFMPSKPDLSYTGLDEFTDKPVAENTNSSEEETKAVRKNSDALIIEEWVLDDEDESVAQPKIIKKQLSPTLLRKSLSNLDNKKR